MSDMSGYYRPGRGEVSALPVFKKPAQRCRAVGGGHQCIDTEGHVGDHNFTPDELDLRPGRLSPCRGWDADKLEAVLREMIAAMDQLNNSESARRSTRLWVHRLESCRK